MKVQSYVIQYKDLTDPQLDILVNVSGCFNPNYSFIVLVKDISYCLETTIELNDGSEVCDCSGRHWVPNYDEDIEFMTKLLADAEGCEYVIVHINN